ncbi:glycoside hydrolase family 2 protein [Paenibacillus sp. FSL W7-1287]|uniref:glycoside hydrolase family 2 protein n=1 Tax=Paenibacillus sp. FSL W7-1287 TaxID=2954538 RepID=UPI0030F77789
MTSQKKMLLIALVAVLFIVCLVTLTMNMREKKMITSDTDMLVENTVVHLIEHDGVQVAYQNGLPIPEFSTWKMNEERRQYISLNGEWKFGHEDDINCPQADLTCSDTTYDDSAWSVQPVPASLDLAYDNKKYQYTFGSFWFRKVFKVEQDWNDKFVKLNALGMGYHSVVYINGTKVGVNEGSATPFSFNVSPYLNYGEDNIIAVQIIRPAHDHEDVGALPAGGFDWWDYSGITRDIYLEATAPQTISKVIVDASPLKKRVRASVVLLNYSKEAATLDVQVHPGVDNIEAQTKSVTLGADEVKVVGFEFDTPDIEAWSTESPNLYQLTAEIVNGDRLKTQYGAVDVEVGDAKVLVNGSPEWFKATNWHDENKESGRSMSPEEYRAEIDVAKSASANLIRNAHYNRHPYAYEYADQIGIFVMDEIENYWLSEQAIGHQLYEKGLSREKAIAMAWNQVNHPSVIIWSVANENTPNNTTHLAWFNDMRDAVRLVDPKKRPVTYASNTQHHPVDMSMSAADIIGFNQYYGFHGGESEDYGAEQYRKKLLEIHERYPSKPIILSENGTWSSLGDRAREQWQAGNFAAHWDVTVTYPFTAGYTFWNLKDYRSKMEYTSRDPQRLSGMGMVDWNNRAPKVVYYYFQEATDRGANRIMNPRFERGIEEWQVISSNKQSVTPTEEGLQLTLNASDSIMLKQNAFDLLAGKYVLELQLSSPEDAVAGKIVLKSSYLSGGSLEKTFDSSGTIKLPFTLTHNGVTSVSVQLQLEGTKANEQIIIEQVNLFPELK